MGLKTKIFYKECRNSLALLPRRDFAVFERQFLLEYYTERAKYFYIYLISLALKLPGVNLYLTCFLLEVKPYAMSKNVNNDVSKDPPIARGQFFKMAASRLASFCRCVRRKCYSEKYQTRHKVRNDTLQR